MDIENVTPEQTAGPFYPTSEQLQVDNDLTLVENAKRPALGKQIYIEGQITTTGGAPVAGALVEIWQACATGRYNHHEETNTAPLDPNFRYWGKTVSDLDGNYSFKTIVPGAYPAEPGWLRPPHIHFKVVKTGYADLTTQMYFEGEALNHVDRILLEVSLEKKKESGGAFRP